MDLTLWIYLNEQMRPQTLLTHVDTTQLHLSSIDSQLLYRIGEVNYLPGLSYPLSFACLEKNLSILKKVPPLSPPSIGLFFALSSSLSAPTPGHSEQTHLLTTAILGETLGLIAEATTPLLLNFEYGQVITPWSLHIQLGTSCLEKEQDWFSKLVLFHSFVELTVAARGFSIKSTVIHPHQIPFEKFLLNLK